APIDAGRRFGWVRAQVADDRQDRRIGVQLLRHPHRDVLAARVVGDFQLERPASPRFPPLHATPGVDLLDRQLGGPQHGRAARLLAARDAAAFERVWDALGLDRLAWEALALARRSDRDAIEPALAQVDRRLLAVLERSRAFRDRHFVTFRVPELERWQHATAAALVGARWGVAGLRTVVADTQAPIARRYFAFLGLAEQHPDAAWPLFERYLVTPGAHHAFVAAA